MSIITTEDLRARVGVIAVLVAALLLMAGVVELRRMDRAEAVINDRVVKEREKDAQACRDRDGIPIYSHYDNAIIDCRPLPKKP